MPDTEDHVGQERLKFQLEAIGHHIQLLQEEARAEKESTKEMVSDISHQLKTPVAALDTCFSILLRNNLSETEQQDFASAAGVHWTDWKHCCSPCWKYPNWRQV